MTTTTRQLTCRHPDPPPRPTQADPYNYNGMSNQAMGMMTAPAGPPPMQMQQAPMMQQQPMQMTMQQQPMGMMMMNNTQVP